MAELLYHNDGKGKWQSHEVYSEELNNHLVGYGATKEEAYQEFVGKLDDYLERLLKFRKEVSVDSTISVDCLGKPI